MVHHITFSVQDALSFLPEFQVSTLSHRKAPSNHCKASILFFPSFTSFDHPFITGVLHGGSTWWFIKDLIPSRSAHRDSFQRSSSILLLALPNATFVTLSFEVVLCHFDNFLHASWFTSVRNEIFKPIIFFLGVILGYISPKAFPKDCCYLWC